MNFVPFVLFVGVVGYAVYDYDIRGKSVIKVSFPTAIRDIEFGSGYNSIRLKRTHNTAVDVDRDMIEPEHRNIHIEIIYKIKLCKSREEFSSAFSGGISASGSYMGVEGSASAAFLTETKITSLDSVLIASVDAITDTQISTNARFNEMSKNILASGEFADFTEKFGTHYLRKVIMGGKMKLVMKFSSTSKEIKKELDSKLSVFTGIFRTEAEFTAKMKDIREESCFDTSLYVSGGTVAPDNLSIEKCIDYAVSFAKSILDYPAVREVEFVEWWNFQEAPDSFKDYIFTQQAKADILVHLSVALLNVQSQLEDWQALKCSDMSYVSETGWNTVQTLLNKAIRYRRELQADFRTHRSDKFDAIIQQYSGKDKEVADALKNLLKSEKRYDSSKKMYMKSSSTNLFISTNDGVNPSLDRYNPIHLWMQDIDIPRQNNVYFGESHYVYIGSHTMPNHYLCMEKGTWYYNWSRHVFWKSNHHAHRGCHWRLAHSTNYIKPNLEFGDRILIYNRQWTGNIMGVSNNDKWIYTVAAEHASNRRHQWIVDKTQSCDPELHSGPKRLQCEL